MEIGKKSILLALAIFVLALATGGEYANNLLEQKYEAQADFSQENKDTHPRNAELSIDIFNSVIHVDKILEIG